MLMRLIVFLLLFNSPNKIISCIFQPPLEELSGLHCMLSCGGDVLGNRIENDLSLGLLFHGLV